MKATYTLVKCAGLDFAILRDGHVVADVTNRTEGLRRLSTLTGKVGRRVKHAEGCRVVYTRSGRQFSGTAIVSQVTLA